MTAAVTFDFHNTLVRCDRWFDLEVRSLPVVVHQALFARATLTQNDALIEAYRKLRSEVIAHGREMDAVNCVAETYRRIGLSVAPTELQPIVDAVMAEALEEAELLPGVRSTLQFLRSHSVRLGIVSSAVHHLFLEWALERFDVADAFDVVVSSARAGYYKSRREIYDYALDSLGANANRSVHVGDSYRFDHLAARDIGLATVWIREPSSVGTQIGSIPDLELTTLEGAGPEILALFQSRQGNSSAD